MPIRHDLQRGFTLVELSIVLVIIGLIIGGVLSGQQIIQNARVTNAINAMQAYEAQFQTYAQNYGALPGDDSQAAKTRFPNAGIPGNGNGNNSLDGLYDSTSPTDETELVWADLRAAGLVKNQEPITAQPINPFGGIYGFQTGAFGTGGLTGTVLCMNGVPAAAAQAIDSRLDDGNSNSGAIQAMVDPGTAGALAGGSVALNYGVGPTYILCIRLN